MAIASPNPDTPNGFQPVGSIYAGTNWYGNIRLLPANASTSSDIFRGDLVMAEATGNVEVYAASSVNVLGVFLGVSDVSLRTVANVEHPGFYDASEMTTADLLVAMGEGLIVEAQEDGASDPLELADIMSNVEALTTAGSTLTGLSLMEIDSSSHATTNTLPLKILRLVNRPNNQLGDSDTTAPNARWLCTMNNTHFSSAGLPAGL